MFDAPAFAQGTVIGTGDVRAVSYGADAGLFVEFYSEPQYMEFQSLEAGKAIYRDIQMVRIYVPGDKTKVVCREVRMQPDQGAPSDPDRWPTQWAAFKSGALAEMAGTPLSTWAMINRNQVNEFKSFNVHTVEHLAEVPDTHLDSLGHGSRALRDSAKEWVARANDDGAVARMKSEFEREMAAMREQIAAMRAAAENSKEPEEARRGPGRPKKEEVA